MAVSRGQTRQIARSRGIASQAAGQRKDCPEECPLSMRVRAQGRPLPPGRTVTANYLCRASAWMCRDVQDEVEVGRRSRDHPAEDDHARYRPTRCASRSEATPGRVSVRR